MCNLFKRGIRAAYSFVISRQLKAIGGIFLVNGDVSILGGKYIQTKGLFYAGRGLRLEAIDEFNEKRYMPEIIFGSNFSAGEGLHIGAIDHVEIGNDVLLGSKVYITDHQHGTTTYEDMSKAPEERTLVSKGPVIIQDRVWIGDNAVILDGVLIGHNSIVAAGAIVTGKVPPYSVVAGVPARVIKKVEK